MRTRPPTFAPTSHASDSGPHPLSDRLCGRSATYETTATAKREPDHTSQPDDADDRHGGADDGWLCQQNEPAWDEHRIGQWLVGKPSKRRGCLGRGDHQQRAAEDENARDDERGE